MQGGHKESAVGLMSSLYKEMLQEKAKLNVVKRRKMASGKEMVWNSEPMLSSSAPGFTCITAL